MYLYRGCNGSSQYPTSVIHLSTARMVILSAFEQLLHLQNNRGASLSKESRVHMAFMFDFHV